MSDFSASSAILATTNMFMAPMLRVELERMGFPVLRELPHGVETEGTMLDAIRLNRTLRTAHRVMYRLGTFKAFNPDILYKEIKRVNWPSWLKPDGYFRVDSAVRHPSVRDTRFANLRVKDAIVDRMREEYGQRPDSGSEHKGASVFVFWSDREGAVYLDTSGEPLSRRGYRVRPFGAPMQETLAAAVLIQTGWEPTTPLLNPMCGGGTLAIEAAMMASNRLPGLLRKEYAYQYLKGYHPQMDLDIVEEMLQGIRSVDGLRIHASDIDHRAAQATRQNAARAGVRDLIDVVAADFRRSPVPELAEGEHGAIVLNPEYGEQMGEEEELHPVYRAIGDWFKQDCQGYTGFVFTGSPGLAKSIGLRPSQKTPFLNGKIECRLLRFDIYSGSKKTEE